MATAIKTRKLSSTKKVDLTAQEPRKLSKTGRWLRDNPEGMFIIVNRKCVNQ